MISTPTKKNPTKKKANKLIGDVKAQIIEVRTWGEQPYSENCCIVFVRVEVTASQECQADLEVTLAKTTDNDGSTKILDTKDNSTLEYSWWGINPASVVKGNLMTNGKHSEIPYRYGYIALYAPGTKQELDGMYACIVVRLINNNGKETYIATESPKFVAPK